MKTTTKIYDSIVYADNMELYETTHRKELEALFRSSISAISETVGPELKEALFALESMALDLAFSAHQCGIAQGIELAMSLKEILGSPKEIAEDSGLNASSLSEAVGSEIEAIGKYLESVDGKDEVA